MTRSRIQAAVLALGALALAATVLAGDSGVLFVGGGGEVFDLADLRDGETRVFGEGERQFTAVREGDRIVLTRDGGEAGRRIELTCAVGSDTCQVITAADGEHVALRIEQKRTCEDGDRDCALHDVNVVALGPGRESNRFLAGNDLHWVASDDAGAARLLVLDGGDQHFGPGSVRLTCPEGDASIRVEADEADQTFLCPKHALPMERRPERQLQQIVIDTETY